MRDKDPNWEWYRTFLNVMETGSLSGAGRAMGITQPTVGRHIDGLEAALSLTLFTRTFDGFTPTDAARALAPYAADVAATAAALQRVASSHGSGIRGTVRLTASEVMGVEVLPPILAALREQYPELVVELVLSNKVDDLLHREADIAVRMVKPVQDALVATRVGDIEAGFYAHERYLAAHGTPKSIAALTGHALIGFDREDAFVRTVQARFPFLLRTDLAFRSDSHLAQLAALRAGYGIGVCQCAIASRDASLIHVLPNAFSYKMDTWLAMHEDLRHSPRCAATFTAVAEGLRTYIAGGAHH
jgi:DNA-binding transcriptional LysR family regulator